MGLAGGRRPPEHTIHLAHSRGVLLGSAPMTFVPPNPHLTLRALQEALADLRQLAALSAETSAYAEAAAHVQAAIATLEREATPPTP